MRQMLTGADESYGIFALAATASGVAAGAWGWTVAFGGATGVTFSSGAAFGFDFACSLAFALSSSTVTPFLQKCLGLTWYYIYIILSRYPLFGNLLQLFSIFSIIVDLDSGCLGSDLPNATFIEGL